MSRGAHASTQLSKPHGINFPHRVFPPTPPKPREVHAPSVTCARPATAFNSGFGFSAGGFQMSVVFAR